MMARILVIMLVFAIFLTACTGSDSEDQRTERSESRSSSRDADRDAESVPTEALRMLPSPTAESRAPTATPSAGLASTEDTAAEAIGHCDPVPDFGPDAHIIETVELNKAVSGRTTAYLTACLEGAWRLMAQLSEHGQLSQVGIAVVDSGLYEPIDTGTERKLALKYEFDWDRIIISDVVRDKEEETEEERIVRSHHGAAVTSVIAAVNHTDESDLPPEFPENTSFSGVITSAPDFNYNIYFLEHTATGKEQPSFDVIKDALDHIIAYGPAIDVVNLSLGLECNPSDGTLAYANCVYNPVNQIRQTNWYRNKIRDVPETIFVVGAGNIGQNAADTTVPARLSLEMENVITVGAIDPSTNNRWAALSNYLKTVVGADGGTRSERTPTG